MFSVIFQWITLGIVLLFLYYVANTWRPWYFWKSGIVGPFPFPIVGSTVEMVWKGFAKFDVDAIRKYGKIFGLMDFNRPMLMISDLDMIRDITTKEFNTFPNRRIMRATGLAGKMLTQMRDDEWRNTRHILTPTFSPRKLKNMTAHINECLSLFARNLGVEADSNDVTDIRDVTGALTMDVIARTAFGIKVDSQIDKNNEFLYHANKAVRFSIRPGLIMAIYFPKLASLLRFVNTDFLPRATTNFFLGIIENVISGRKQEADANAKRTDFIQLMINAHSEDDDETNDGDLNVDQMVYGNGPATADINYLVDDKGRVLEKRGLTKMEILANSILVFVAGYETASVTTSFLFYNLAMNPDCQAKLQAEVDCFLSGKEEIDYETINKMTYLEKCVMENLRLYAPAIRILRNTEKDVEINGIRIKEGTTLAFPVYAIHHDPEIWPDPEKFDPERFSAENRARHHPFQYLPFGAGPRHCVGMRLALFEIKLAVARAVKSFSFEPCAETQIPMKFSRLRALLLPVQGIKLKVLRRK